MRSALARDTRTPEERVTLPSFRGDGLQAGVDLDDTSALLDLMDEPGADA